MARGEMLCVFCYDVSDGKRRRKVAETLEGGATRVQYSVFEARMTRIEADVIAQRAASYLGTGDSLRVYAVGKNGFRRSRVYGDGPPFETTEGYWIF
uniref:CRISPR-associated endonuclease Cas2 n=1 Tax=Yoonia sp. TaxID=2212373 RepID=UPI0040475514